MFYLIYLEHICLEVTIWFALSIMSKVYFPSMIFSIQHQLFLINSFIFILSITAMAFLISQLVNRYEAVSGVTNVTALGLSFLSGAFIPQILLNGFVLKIASFFPPYWFIANNNKIIEMSNFDLNPLLPSMFIQIIFAIAYVATGLAIAKYKSKNSLN